MIDFEHVYKTYETHNDENVALEDINIHIDEGEFVFILGHSGAGKSTFFKAHPDGGEAHRGQGLYQWAGFNAHQAPQGALPAPPDGRCVPGLPPDPHHDRL